MSGFFFFFWNIRGFNKLSKQSVVKDWVRKYGFQIGCLIETRVKKIKLGEYWIQFSQTSLLSLIMIFIVWEDSG